MIPDGAGWHKSKSLVIADNMRVVFLPPYSPELNPMEKLREELREKSFDNQAFESCGTSKTDWRFH